MPNKNKQDDQKRDSQGQFTDKSSSSSPGHSQGSEETEGRKRAQGGQEKERSGDIGHKGGQNY